jgi:parallel beta-helix repeat protein
MKKFLFFFSFFILILISQSAYAATITVCPSGCDNSTIQDAVDAASAGDTILVGDGTYNENLLVSTSVNIRSVNGSNATIINASDPTDNSIYIVADNVNITGFTIQGANDNTFAPAGIYLDGASNTNISNNKITNNYDGILIDDFLANTDNNIITGNNISLNDGIGIFFFTSISSNNLIYNNYFSSNGLGNADDFFGGNFWNTTKTTGTNILGGPFIGGNFWDDYIGADNGNGTFPHNISFDGIGDTQIPYDSGGFVTGGDYLPLVIPDLTPPIFANVKNTTISDTSAVIVWFTNEISDTLIKYNTSAGSYNFTESDSTFTKFHSIVLTNLNPNTTYYFVINSTDPSGNSNQSIEYSFKTGNFYTVCSPTGCDYTTIQGAINNLSSGNKVFVFNGTYNENVVLNKSLTLQGQDRDTTTVDCGTGTCISVDAVGANITGFTVQNGTYGINVNNSNYTTIRNNLVQDNRYAGILLTNSPYSRVIDNDAINNKLYYGIGIKSSAGLFIENNNASSNTFGIFLTQSCDVTVKDSTTNDNSYYGIYLGSLSCSFPPYSNIITNNTVSRNYFGLFGTLINSVNISYSDFLLNIYSGIYLNIGSNTIIQGGTLQAGSTFTTTPPGARVIVDKTWESSDNNFTYTINIDNFGVDSDTFSINVTNVDGVAYSMNESDVTLIPGETATRTLTVGDGTVGDFKMIVEAISKNDSTVMDSIKTTTIVTGSPSNDSVIQNSSIPNSKVTDSAVYNSNITNSSITRSIINNSNITGTNLSDVILENAEVNNGIMSSGNITIEGIKYEVITSISLSQLIVGRDLEDSTLVGVNGTELNVTAANANTSFQISAGGDYIGGTLRIQRSVIVPAGTPDQTNNVGGYSDILVSNNLEEGMNWTYIIMNYNQSEVDAKNLIESSLRLQFYNETSLTWETIIPGGVNTDENYVFANLSHFSRFGIHGNIKPTSQPVSSGGGGDSYKKSTPTVIPSFGTIKISSNDVPNLITQLGYQNQEFHVTPPELLGVLGALDIFSTTPEMADSLTDKRVIVKEIKGIEGDHFTLTSEYVLRKYSKGSPRVIIVRSDIGADSCASVAYAKAIGVPIIIVKTDEIPSIIQTTLDRLNTQETIIVGGTQAVSAGVETSLPTPTRLWGRNRFETAVKLAKALMEIQTTDTIVITDGQDPDMTSVMIAARYGAPIIYTNGEELPPETRAFLEEYKFDRVIIIGIPNIAENEIKIRVG